MNDFQILWITSTRTYYFWYGDPKPFVGIRFGVLRLRGPAGKLALFSTVSTELVPNWSKPVQ